MKTIQEINKRKLPIVAIDPVLDKYRNKIMFPEKLEKANIMLKTAKLPPNQHNSLHDPTCSDQAKSSTKE